MGAQIPQLTISILGAQNSGKSTYISVLYDHVVSAQYEYALHAPTGVRLRDRQEVKELRDGVNLAPTGTEPQEHKYILGSLRNGDYRELVQIDLVDFRGEAPLDPNVPETDSARLYERIPESDSIFVVLDATHFVEPVTAERAEDIAFATMAKDIADRIQDALAKRRAARRPVPSIVVLLSKVDLLDEQVDRPGRKSDLVRDDIYNFILPIAARMGRRAEFFPVSIGRYASKDDEDRLADYEPRGVAGPLFYALAWFLADHLELLKWQHANLEARHREADQHRRSLERRPAFIRWFRRKEIAENRAELARLRASLQAYQDRISTVSSELEMDFLKQMFGHS